MHQNYSISSHWWVTFCCMNCTKMSNSRYTHVTSCTIFLPSSRDPVTLVSIFTGTLQHYLSHAWDIHGFPSSSPQSRASLYNNNNNNNNNQRQCLWCCPHNRGHCESSTGSFDECRLSAGWPPTLRPSQPTWAVSPPINGCYHPHPPSPFVIITQPES